MLRLQRIGKKKQPSYRLIVSEKAKDPQGTNIEIIGMYNPMGKENTVSFDADRVKYWISKGAQTSNTVHNLLVGQGIIEEKSKKKSVALSTKRRGKIEEKRKAEEEKVAAAKAKEQAVKEVAEAEAKAAEEATKAAAETPVEAPAADSAPEASAEGEAKAE